MMRAPAPRWPSPDAMRRMAVTLLSSCCCLPAALAAPPALPVPAAQFVSSGQVAAPVVNGAVMDVTQLSQKAIANWDSFDIGAGATVNIHQPGPSAVLMNRIHQADPSRIEGALNANGQVYLINHNGIIFGDGARVSVHGLLASTLDISDQVFEQGLTQAIETAGGLPALEGGSAPDAVIEVGAGARIEAVGDPTSPGRVILAAPRVSNAGRLSADDGQVILVGARDKVYLKAAPSADPSLRGLLVEVDNGGEASNLGSIVTRRGNTTLLGLAVNQKGRISATTTVRINGSIRLIARDRAGVRPVPGEGNKAVAARTGDLVLGEDSLTEVLPELDDPALAIDEQAQLPSRVELQGHTIHLRSGSRITAPGGEVELVATDNPQGPAAPGLVANQSRLQLDPGSVIDVSGSDRTELPAERNLVQVELRGNELRDAPLQRDGVLRNQTITVDIRKGTPLADISGAMNNIRRGVGERTAKGGRVRLASEGELVVNPGAAIDVSGGKVHYRAGRLATTRLLAQGQVIDIAQASPDRVYDGILGEQEVRDRRFGVETLVGSDFGVYSPAYDQGFDAGSIELFGRRMQVAGELTGGVVRGPWQRDPAIAPRGGTLVLGNAAQRDASGADLYAPSVHLSATAPAAPLAIGDPLPATLEFGLSRLSGSGIEHLTVLSNGTITLDPGALIDLPAGGSLTLRGADLVIDGTIRAPGAAIGLAALPTVEQLTGNDLLFGPTAAIDARGQWINDNPLIVTGQPSSPLYLDGGVVSLEARDDLILAAGSRIRVDGGAHLDADGVLHTGRGGDLSLLQDPVGSGDLRLDAAIGGYALEEGGRFRLRARRLGIGGPGDPLGPALFGAGGFSSYAVEAVGGSLVIAPGTRIEARQVNRVLSGAYGLLPDGADLDRVSRLEVLPDPLRNPVSIELGLVHPATTVGVDDELRLGEGAAITLDPGATLSLRSDGRLTVLGELSAPGGDISLRLLSPQGGGEPGYLPSQTLWLGSRAVLDASAAVIRVPDPSGLPRGRVLEGGSVSLQADRGFIVTEAGSRIDVSGRPFTLSGLVDEPYTADPGMEVIAAAAGRIELRAAEGMLFDGALWGRAAPVAGASGGSLELRLDATTRNLPEALDFGFGSRTIQLRQGGGSVLPPGLRPGDDIPSSLEGVALLSSRQVSDGGFDNLGLKALNLFDPLGQLASISRVRFEGDVRLSLRQSLRIEAAGLSAAGGDVSLSAAYLALGPELYSSQATEAATGGGSTLSLDAGLIELIGSTSLQGIGHATLRARDGVRLRGVQEAAEPRRLKGAWRMAGDLDLLAPQVYPTTLSRFDLETGSGDITVRGDGGAPVLSAGGSLGLHGANVLIDGALEAPLGELRILGDDTLRVGAAGLLSVSAEGQIIPFGQVQAGLDWVMPLGSQTLLFEQPPEKRIELRGDVVELMPGSRIDVGGGGDLLAWEFVPGPGGSSDVLDPAAGNGAFALMPAFTAPYAPYDPVASPATSHGPGTRIELGAGSGLPAGEYTVLPARYALLPGAWLVTPVAGTRGMRPGQTLPVADGGVVVAGRFGVAGTGIHDSLYRGFLVRPGDYAQRMAEYQLSLANTFYTARAAAAETPPPRLPLDAGSILVGAGSALALAATLETATVGKGAVMDISADDLEVVAAPGPANGFVQIEAAQLQGLGVGSLLLGGSRVRGGDGIEIQPAARDLRIGDGVLLEAPELLLVAQDTLTVGAGSRLRAETEAGLDPAALSLAGDAAFARLGSDGPRGFVHHGEAGLGGTLIVERGARLQAAGAMRLDATLDTRVDGELSMTGGSLALGGNRVSLGATDGVPGLSGLVLSNADLGSLQVDRLTLSSRGDFDLYGAIDLDLDELILDGAGLAGRANDGMEAALRARRITLRNSGQTAGGGGTGHGGLLLEAQELEVGPGTFRVSGYDRVALTAGGRFQGRGRARLDLGSARVDLTAGLITGAPGSRLEFETAGPLHLANAAASPGAGEALAARLTLRAAAIDGSARFSLPSGRLRLESGGTLHLGPETRVDVSGRLLDFAGLAQPGPGGDVTLVSGSGDLLLDPGSTFLLDSPGGRAGRLSLDAGQGRLVPAGTLSASGGTGGGVIRLDGGRLETGAGFFADLADSGFSGGIGIRQRTGELRIGVGEVLSADTITIAVDAGALRIGGSLLAGGGGEGRIELWSRDDLVLETGSVLRLTGDLDGRIGLGTVAGVIRQQDGALIDLGPGAGGLLRLRAPRLGSGGVGVAPLHGGDILGPGRIEVEAVRTYEGIGLIDNALISGIRNDTAAFMAAAGGIAPALGMSQDPRLVLVPGVELRAGGDLRLAGDWSLLDWRYGGEPGLLTLRAAGDLLLEHSLEDGFGSSVVGGMVPDDNYLQEGPSWSYRLVAGADPGAARPLAVRAGAGDIRIASGRRLRTGTGDIALAAGGDLVLADDTAVVYTAGRAEAVGRWGGGALSDVPGLSYFSIPGEYPVDGGDIDIDVGGDILGAVTRQFVTDWQYRIGEGGRPGDTPTAWSVVFNDPFMSGRNHLFRQNIGALGGGDVRIRAGGDILDLSVAIPTTGKQRGDTAFSFATSRLELTGANDIGIAGGGTLEVEAGGDVTGGSFHLGRGQARIRAGGVIGSSGATGLAPVLAQGDAVFELEAGGDLRLEGALNPTAMPQGFAPLGKNYFFSYGEESRLTLQSLAGDIHLGYGTDTLKSAFDLAYRGAEERVLQVAPPIFQARALQGSVILENSFTLYPSARGGFSILAGRDVTTPAGASVVLNLADSDPSLLPPAEAPAASINGAIDRLSSSGEASIIHAAVPLHLGDPGRAVVVARQGDIRAAGSVLQFQSGMPVELYAGRDLVDVSIKAQNVDAGDFSRVRAGRDIRYRNQRDANGNFRFSAVGMSFAGPGRADIVAGRHIDLGGSAGIASIGDLENPALADSGADLTLLAGVGAGADHPAFIDRYLDASRAADYLRTLGVTVAAGAALDRFRALDPERQRPLLLDRLFEIIVAAGVSGAFDQGFEAIDTLFPADGAAGDLTLFTSKIHTQDGGDINLLAPHGLVNAGLATSSGGGKEPSQLGVVAQRDGDIRALVRDDFLVNQSRVFALDGGDIVIWSSRGNIDAGRGAKTAIAAPPPVVTFDASGNLRVEFPPAIAGSGIRGAVSTPGRPPGDVYLFAPAGVVSAGDAGIGSAGNITIAATEVIGADNIDVGGVSVGVPAADSGSLGAGLGSLGNVAGSVSKAAEETAASSGEDEEAASSQTVQQPELHLISVEVLGFGAREEEHRRKRS